MREGCPATRHLPNRRSVALHSAQMLGAQPPRELCDTRVHLLGPCDTQTSIGRSTRWLRDSSARSAGSKRSTLVRASSSSIGASGRNTGSARRRVSTPSRASAGTWLRQCKIAELSVDDSAVAGFAAAVLHEIPGYRPGHIELVATANASRVHPFATVHRYAGVRTTTMKGIRTTTYAQTVCDIAPRTSLWRLERSHRPWTRRRAGDHRRLRGANGVLRVQPA